MATTVRVLNDTHKTGSQMPSPSIDKLPTTHKQTSSPEMTNQTVIHSIYQFRSTCPDDLGPKLNHPSSKMTKILPIEKVKNVIK